MQMRALSSLAGSCSSLSVVPLGDALTASSLSSRRLVESLPVGRESATARGITPILIQAERLVRTLHSRVEERDDRLRQAHLVLEAQQTRNEELSLMLQHAEAELQQARSEVAHLRASLLHVEEERDDANGRAEHILKDRDFFRQALEGRTRELHWSRVDRQNSNVANTRLVAENSRLRQDVEEELPRLRAQVDGLVEEMARDRVPRGIYDAVCAERGSLRAALAVRTASPQALTDDAVSEDVVAEGSGFGGVAVL